MQLYFAHKQLLKSPVFMSPVDFCYGIQLQ